MAGERQLPQAVEGEALAALFQMISPRIRKPFGHIPDDIGMEGNIRFAPQVGDVDAGPAPGHQDPVDLLPDPAQKSEIFFQGHVLVVLFPDVIRRRGHHQVDAVVREFCHVFRRFGRIDFSYSGGTGFSKSRGPGRGELGI